MIAKEEISIKQQFHHWVLEYTDDMYRWALHKVSHKHTAEDIVQDTFLSAYSAVTSFKENSGPKTWLFSILNRKIIDHYRKAARNIEEREYIGNRNVIENSNELFNEYDGWNESVTVDFWNDEQELLDNHQFLTVLSNCISKLPAQWETSLTAKYLLEKDSKSICKELNITPSNYWQILHRAKLVLKKCLETNWFNH